MPAVLFDDSAAEREAYAGTIRFGREENVENAIHRLRSDTDAVVADFEQHFLAVQSRRTDRSTGLALSLATGSRW